VSDQELKQLVAGIAVAQKETDRQLKELDKQIGGPGNKFGDFAEGMAIPSLVEILLNDSVPNRSSKPGGRENTVKRSNSISLALVTERISSSPSRKLRAI
jgi:hypothetical protein